MATSNSTVNIGNAADPAMAFSDALAPGTEIDATERARSREPLKRVPTERDPLLPPRSPTPSLREVEARSAWFWKAGRHWLIPFWVLAAFSRGMTLAPRIEIYTNLACEAYLPGADQVHRPVISLPNNGSMVPALTRPSILDLPEHLLSIDAFASSLAFATTNHHTFNEIEHDTIGELPKEICFKDPVVQQAAAKLQMAVVLTMGILSSATTGWWGSVGDRIGRTKVLALSLMGYLFTDLMFLVTAMYAKALAPWGGHRLLILGPVVEGLLGGWATTTAAVNAYVSDITPHGSRAHSFSTFQGILFVGVALGPAFGSLILKLTNEVLAVFLVSVVISLANSLFAAFIVPESLSEEAKRANRTAVVTQHSCTAEQQSSVLAPLVAKVVALFSTLKFFAPRGKDRRLTYLAVGWFAVMMTVGVYPLKLLYAEHMFSWSAAELGNYLSFIGTARAVHLLVTLPLLIHHFKPKHHPLTVEESATVTGTPTTPTIDSEAGPASQELSEALEAHRQDVLRKDFQFDLTVARISLGIDALSYIAVSLTSSPIAFLLSTGLASFAGGVSPAVQSLCMLLLDNPKEDTGKMFGALSMIQAVAATIVSPIFFGMVYSMTVEAFPAAIYVSGAALIVVALCALLLVRPQKPRKHNQRGRSTRTKRLSCSTTREGSLARD